MVKIDKEYLFEDSDGKASLLDLFDGRSLLIVYHFMFDPSWDEGCPRCSFLVDNIGHLAHLHARDTSLAVVSRASLTKSEPFKTRMKPIRNTSSLTAMNFWSIVWCAIDLKQAISFAATVSISAVSRMI